MEKAGTLLMVQARVHAVCSFQPRGGTTSGHAQHCSETHRALAFLTLPHETCVHKPGARERNAVAGGSLVGSGLLPLGKEAGPALSQWERDTLVVTQ